MEWSYDPEIIRIGWFALRYYSLAFMISFLLGYHMLGKIYAEEGKPEAYLEELFLWVFAGTIIGARLGHCLFYDPGFYLSNPLKILYVWEGGLASHGAAIGIPLAIYLYVRKKDDLNFLWVVDRLVIFVALAGAFIRIGNLFNSEIYGKPTDVPWAFTFTMRDNIPRHPTQIYEAVCYLIIFFILYRLYQKWKPQIPQGYFLGVFLAGIFGVRFFIEFLKENQVAFEDGLPLNMGQLLSIPLVALGLWLMQWSKKQPLPTPVKKPQRKKKKKAG